MFAMNISPFSHFYTYLYGTHETADAHGHTDSLSKSLTLIHQIVFKIYGEIAGP